MSLALKVKELMERRGDASVMDAKRRTGVGYATMHAILEGGRTNVSRETLERIADGYNVPVSVLLGEEDAADGEITELIHELSPDAREALLHFLRLMDKEASAADKQAEAALVRARCIDQGAVPYMRRGEAAEVVRRALDAVNRKAAEQPATGSQDPRRAVG